MDNLSLVSPRDVTWVAWEPGDPWDVHGILGHASQICRCPLRRMVGVVIVGYPSVISSGVSRL
jgi:hypothetical protein